MQASLVSNGLTADNASWPWLVRIWNTSIHVVIMLVGYPWEQYDNSTITAIAMMVSFAYLLISIMPHFNLG